MALADMLSKYVDENNISKKEKKYSQADKKQLIQAEFYKMDDRFFTEWFEKFDKKYGKYTKDTAEGRAMLEIGNLEYKILEMKYNCYKMALERDYGFDDIISGLKAAIRENKLQIKKIKEALNENRQISLK